MKHNHQPFEHYESEPDTSWVKPLVAVVAMTFLGYLTFVVVSLVEVRGLIG